MRALAIEAEYDKREILQAYLNQVYYGHVDGLAVHGIGTATRVYFSKSASRLSLAESALLAAIIQGPNRLSPVRHPERAKDRRDWVLSRMEELEWAGADEVRRAKRAPVKLRLESPDTAAPRDFLSWVNRATREEAGDRLDRGRGVRVETTLDPYLQHVAEQAVSSRLHGLRRRERRLSRVPLAAALVALDASNGDVLAYVGGDPDRRDDFDRARMAERQPGSTVKPFVLLEALGDCGARQPLHAASRIADEPLRIDLPSGPWEPENADGRYRGEIDLRTALAESRNVPLVRVARWCGWTETAGVFEAAGLDLPDEPPPSFVLGSIETTPLRLARAYTILSTQGDRLEPVPARRIETPSGSRIWRSKKRKRRVASPAVTYLVRDMMRSAVARGTANVAHAEGWDVAAKTGSTSELRDAWFAGHAGGVVTVVWVGIDDGSPLGLPGSAAAGPIWSEFMKVAVPARPYAGPGVPRRVVEKYIEPDTGLLVRKRNRRARKELFREGALPPRDRFWRADRPVPVVR